MILEQKNFYVRTFSDSGLFGEKKLWFWFKRTKPRVLKKVQAGVQLISMYLRIWCSKKVECEVGEDFCFENHKNQV